MIKRLFQILVLSLYVVLAVPSYADKEPVHILFLSSYNRSEHLNSLLFDDFETIIEARHKEKDIIEDVFTINYLEKWQPIEGEIVSFLRTKVIDFQIVMALGSPAESFLKTNRNKILGPTIPAIFIGQERDVVSTSDKTFSILLYIDLTKTIDLAKEISDRVIVVYDYLAYQPPEDPDVVYLKYRSKAWVNDNLKMLIEDGKKKGITYSIVFKSALDTEVGLGYYDNQTAITDINTNLPGVPIFVTFDHIITDKLYDLSNVVVGGYVIEVDAIVNYMIKIFDAISNGDYSTTEFIVKNDTLKLNYHFVQKYPKLKHSNAIILNTPHTWVGSHIPELVVRLYNGIVDYWYDLSTDKE